MKNLWKYLAILFAGIIAGLAAAYKLIDPRTINTSTYVEDQKQETKIGKIKQKKGMDNLQEVTQDPSLGSSDPSRKQSRQERRAERKNRKNHSR